MFDNNNYFYVKKINGNCYYKFGLDITSWRFFYIVQIKKMKKIKTNK